MHSLKKYLAISLMLNVAVISTNDTPYEPNTDQDKNPQTEYHEKVEAVIAPVTLIINKKEHNPYERLQESKRITQNNKKCTECVDYLCDYIELVSKDVESNLETFEKFIDHPEQVLDMNAVEGCAAYLPTSTLLQVVASKFEKQGNTRTAALLSLYINQDKKNHENSAGEDLESLMPSVQKEAIRKLSNRLHTTYSTLYPNQPVYYNYEIASKVVNEPITATYQNEKTNTLDKKTLVLSNDIKYIIQTFFENDADRFYAQWEAYEFAKKSGFHYMVSTWANYYKQQTQQNQQQQAQEQALKKKDNEWYPKQIVGGLVSGLAIGGGVVGAILKNAASNNGRNPS